ncbi:MAG: molybdate ABC transporter substrate-binding protein [Microthrixaceae bacterium]
MTRTHRRKIPAMSMAVAVLLLGAVFALLSVAACTSDASGAGGGEKSATDGRSDASEKPESAGPLSGAVTVSAAASLTEVFTRIRTEFQAENPGTKLELNFGSSGQLSAQIGEGAPVDVAAFADTTPMDALANASLLDGGARTFARNKLVIVTKADNPEGIRGLADLANVGVISLCNDNAPCGKFADRVLANASVVIDQSKVTRGQDVKATLGAVTRGDAVAGIVYATDAASAKDVDTITIPDDLNVIADYPIAVAKDSDHPRLARAFVDYVLGERGQAVLSEFGFLAA